MKRMGVEFCVGLEMLCLLLSGALVWAETEPNNDIASANPVELNQTVSGSLSSSDASDGIDCYRFDIPSDGYFQLGVVPTADLNVEIILKDSDGMYDLGYKNDTGKGGTEGIVYPNLRAGTYYAIVKIPDAISPVQGTYDATFSFLPVEEIDSEPNDTPAQAVMLPVNGESNGHIGYHGGKFTDNRDYYKITLPQDGKLELTVYPDGTGNVVLGLYDSILVNNLSWMDQKGKGESEKIVYPNLLAGTYIVLVYRTDGYGSYNLTSLFTADPAADTEPNDSIGQAANVNLTMESSIATVTGRMGYYGNQYRDDNDYFKVNLPAYGNLTIGAVMDAGSGLNVGFQLWDQDLRYLGSGGTFAGLNPGIYYVRLYRNDGYGSYTATFTFEAKEVSVSDGLSTVVLDPNGSSGVISISAENPVFWYSVNLPEDGALTVKMQFDNQSFVYMRLFNADGVSRIAEVNAYWTNDERSIVIPNLRKGTYVVQIARTNGGSTGQITSSFVPLTKLDAEPNDEYTTLTPVAYNQTYSGHIGYYGNGWNDNLDLYLLDIPEDGSLSATITGESTGFYYIYLFSKDGNAYGKISENNGYWTADPRTVGKANILAGQYLVQISRADGYCSYDLKIDFTPTRSNDIETNGNDGSQPVEIQPVGGYVGHIGYNRNFFMDSNDYYKVVLPEDGSFYVTCQSDKTGFNYWRLYQSDFKTVISEQNSYWTTDQRTIGSDRLRAGTYYVAVDRADGYATYHFYTQYTPQLFKDLDSNHLASQATEIQLNDLIQGALGYGDLFYTDNTDWYKVNVAETGKYKLSLHATNSSFDYVELYAANWVTRYTSDNRYWTSDPFTREIDLDPGTYYIKCYRADGVGPYNMRLGSVEGAIAGTLTGKVSAASGFSLAEITVKVLNREVKTDVTGVYKVENLPPGQYSVSFTSGTKYYPETAAVTMKAGETTTQDIIMVDSNKTAPQDVSLFYAVPNNQYIHFFWSPSVSADVADGGGYKLYINGGDSLDLGSVLFYRSLGFENGVQYTCRLTAYDKYGNESAGKTLVITPTGEIMIPTPTPTLPPGQATPTPTVTPKPQVTLTPTPTSVGGNATPTPTYSGSDVTPTPGQPVVVKPSFVYEFEKATMKENGWSEVSGGFGGAVSGTIVPYYGFPSGSFASSADQRGVAVAVKPNEVTFIMTQQAINTGGHPALIRCQLKSTGSNAILAVGALKGSLATAENLDGTIGYNLIMTAGSFVDQEGRICTVFRPDSGETINPFIQVAGQAGDTVTVWIDRMEIFILDPDAAYPGELFR